jgi:UDPglucose 6-dehydrogenase
VKIGLVGLGKLGTPVALAMTMKGHDVMGFDVDPARMQKERFPHCERGPDGEPDIQPLLQASTLRFGSLTEVVEHAEIIFVAVQTPHEPSFEGVSRLPSERTDFDYSYLVSAMADLSAAIGAQAKPKIVVVISTVLPGTVRREILPLINEYVQLCYNPFFIAMGTTIQDFLNPEFVLLGTLSGRVPEPVKALYRTIHDRPLFETSIDNAELIKVSYNTFISMKICFANTLMEICHKLPGADVDVVTDALSLATDRLLSPRYLRGGMGDGGACHPRDNIALSWLARQLDLSYDWFDGVMRCREQQTEWLAELVIQFQQRRGLTDARVGIYGRAFKAGTNIVTGSPATLLANILRERGLEVHTYDPYIDAGPCPFDWPGVYVIATNHADFADPSWSFPAGSIIVDPWRYLPARVDVDVEVVPVGIGDEIGHNRERQLTSASNATYATP